jgi:hypothetical protein
MNPYLLLRLLHVLAAIVFVGGLFARQAKAGGAITPEVRVLLADPVVRRARLAEMVGLGIIVVLMVLRPF